MDDDEWSDWSDEFNMLDSVPSDSLSNKCKSKGDTSPQDAVSENIYSNENKIQEKNSTGVDQEKINQEQSESVTKQQNATEIQYKDSSKINREHSESPTEQQNATEIQIIDSTKTNQERSESVTGHRKASKTQDKDSTEISQGQSEGVAVQQNATEIQDKNSTEMFQKQAESAAVQQSSTEIQVKDSTELNQQQSDNVAVQKKATEFRYKDRTSINQKQSVDVTVQQNASEIQHKESTGINQEQLQKVTVPETADGIQSDVNLFRETVGSDTEMSQENGFGRDSIMNNDCLKDNLKHYISEVSQQKEPTYEHNCTLSQMQNVIQDNVEHKHFSDRCALVQESNKNREYTDTNFCSSDDKPEISIKRSDTTFTIGEQHQPDDGNEQDLDSSSEELVSLAELKRKLKDKKCLKPPKTLSTPEKELQKSSGLNNLFSDQEDMQFDTQTNIQNYIDIYLQEPDFTFTNDPTTLENEDTYFASPDIGDVTVIVETMDTDDTCDQTENADNLSNSNNLCSGSDLPVQEAQRTPLDSTQVTLDIDGYSSDTPLAFIQKNKWNAKGSTHNAPRKTKSDSDSEFTPSKFSSPSSATASESEDCQAYNDHEYSTKKKPAQKRKYNARDKSWKRRGKRIRRKTITVRKQIMKKTNKTLSKEAEKTDETNANEVLETSTEASYPHNRHTMSSCNGVEKAIKLSLKEQKLQTILHKYHAKRLDKLLASNMMERVSIPADGNCLLGAVLHQLGESMSAQTLRAQVAKHLEDNIIHYLCFVNFPDAMTSEQEIEVFVKMIEEIKEDGTWNNEMSDFIPLCLANMFRRPIRIFSSRPFQPVIDIEPDLAAAVNESPILVAHVAMHGTDHYDAVEKKMLSNDYGNTAEKSNFTEMNDEVEEGNEPIQHCSDPPETCMQSQSEIKTPSKQLNSTSIQPAVTPHKDATYRSPKRRKLFRKRIAQKKQWKSQIRKENRARGKAYVGKLGRSYTERSVQPVNCSKCRQKCSEKIEEEQRQTIFETYWELGDYSKQRHFICTHVEQQEPKRIKVLSKRKRSVSQFFYLTVGQEKIQVCKNFFLKTLNLGRKTVDYAIKNKTHGVFTGKDRRGSQTPANKTPEGDITFVRQHIESFPTIDPHYTRKDTKRKYLPQELNIRRMHSLYIDKCKETSRKPVKEKVYRNLFCNEYNLSFFHPKKDQCQVCNHFENLKAEGKVDANMQQEYDKHQDRKKMSRLEKEKDKRKAKSDPTYHVSAFDLEAVLTTPCSLVGELYYKHKLCCYNLSFYSLGNSNATCYLWDETQGRRGSCEIGSCILLHLNSLAAATSKVEEVTYYSDTCGGQNRNQFVAAALMYNIRKNNKIKCISQKFLESGHSEMECDSIHATIEHAKKRTRVYVPSQWETVITLARKNKPYIVVPLKYVDFMDLKKLKKEHFKNMKVDDEGQRINWLKLKWIQVRRDFPNSLFLNYTFDATLFKEVRVTLANTRGRPKVTTEIKLTQRYKGKLAISTAKKADLLSLCSSGTIPEEYHGYFESLVSSKSLKDKLPLPAASENEEDTDEN